MSKYLPNSQKIRQLPGKIYHRLREHGLGNSLAWCWYQAAWRLREWRLGIDTREFAHGVVVDDQGACHGYEPIDHRCLDIILDYLNPTGDNEQVFLDYGCGMGRAVVVAATRPFRRVIGVEIDPSLVEIAQRQIDRAAGRGHLRCRNVEIVTTDASTWSVPADVNCVFLFNSFTGDLLAAVLEQIRRSLVNHPRSLKLVYTQPVVDRDSLADCTWLQQCGKLPTGFWTHVRTVVYEPHADLATPKSPSESFTGLASKPIRSEEFS